MTLNLLPFGIAFLLPPLVVIFSQAILHRLLKKQSPQAVAMISMVIGYPLFFACTLLLPFSIPYDVTLFAYLFLLYSFSAYTYFHVFNMSQTSRRIRLILSVGTGQRTKLGQMSDLYVAEDMLQVRLDRLEKLGQIRHLDGRYFVRGRLFPTTASVLFLVGKAVNRAWPELTKFMENPE